MPLGAGDTKLVIDQVMKDASSCCDVKMTAYCDKVRKLKEGFGGTKLHHILGAQQ
jgi:hypothetical protein